MIGKNLGAFPKVASCTVQVQWEREWREVHWSYGDSKFAACRYPDVLIFVISNYVTS